MRRTTAVTAFPRARARKRTNGSRLVCAARCKRRESGRESIHVGTERAVRGRDPCAREVRTRVEEVEREEEHVHPRERHCVNEERGGSGQGRAFRSELRCDEGANHAR